MSLLKAERRKPEAQISPKLWREERGGVAPNFWSFSAEAWVDKLWAGAATLTDGFGARCGKAPVGRDFGFRTTGGAAGFGAERVGLTASSCDGGRHFRTGLGVFFSRSFGFFFVCLVFSFFFFGVGF